MDLDTQYSARGLTILAFPCNQFAGQEPGTNEEIVQFAQGYNVKFKMFSKISVNGSQTIPLYAYLKSQKAGLLGSFIKWNYTKFLCDRQGQVVMRYSPNISPLSIVPDIEKCI